MKIKENVKQELREQSLVTQSNKLIEGSYSVNLSEIRLLWLALTKVDSKLPQPEREYTLTAGEYSAMYGLDLNNGYKQLRTIADTLGTKPIITYEFNEKKKRIDKVSRFWFSKISYGIDGEPEINLKFSDEVSQYLYEIKSEFTQMNIFNMTRLDSSFAFRLFSWLSKYKNLDAYKMSNGVIKTEPFSIAWMKERFGLLDKYNEYKHFKVRILEPAVESINRTTNYNVTYEQKKTGKAVTHIVFKFVDSSEKNKLNLKSVPPKLPRKPSSNSKPEILSAWAENCIKLITDFERGLIKQKKKGSLSKPLLRKLIELYGILGDQENMKLREHQLSAK